MQVLTCSACRQILGCADPGDRSPDGECWRILTNTIQFKQTSKRSDFLKGSCSNCLNTVCYERILDGNLENKLEFRKDRINLEDSDATHAKREEGQYLCSPIDQKVESDILCDKDLKVLRVAKGSLELRMDIQSSFSSKLSHMESKVAKAQNLIQKLLCCVGKQEL